MKTDMPFLIFFDHQASWILFRVIPHNPLFDSVFSFFSFVGGSIFFWLLIIALLVVFEEKRDHRFIIYFLVSFASTAYTVNILLKNLFERSRPFVTWHLDRGFCPGTYSFPSGHASVAFAAAAILAAFDKKRVLLYYAIASVIAFSRIYLGCHYLSDVVVGAIVGYFISTCILHIHTKYHGSNGKRLSNKKIKKNVSNEV